MSLYLSLNPLQNLRHLALEQWQTALRQAGHHVEEAALRRPDRSPEEHLRRLWRWIELKKPKAIFTASALTFTLPEFFQHEAVRSRPVVAFWFDDPLRPVERWRHQPEFLPALRQPNVHHFIWDGYWRDWLWREHHVRSHPIHLAADPAVFRPLPRPGEYADAAIFIGSLLSARHLRAGSASFPILLQKIAHALPAAFTGAVFGENPYTVLATVTQSFSTTQQEEMENLRHRNPDAWLALLGLVSKLGKNEVRLRMLRAALLAAEVLVLCGNLENTHLSEAELRDLLRPAETKRLHFRDTGHLSDADLPLLYAYGAVHLQATDPQSVHGGLPFRVFQTTAAGQPLFSDVKAELLDCYAENSEMAFYRNEEEIAPRLAQLLANKSARTDLADAGHARFLREHTWAHRVATVLDFLQIPA